jgi:hypothetical protein
LNTRPRPARARWCRSFAGDGVARPLRIALRS